MLEMGLDLLFKGPQGQGLSGCDLCRFPCRAQGREKGCKYSQPETFHEDPWGDDEMLRLDQDVESGDRSGNEIEHDLRQADSHSYPDQASQSPDQGRLADHETEDLGSGR